MYIVSFMMVASIIFWGYCNNYLIIGFILAALMAPTPFLRSRLEFSLKQIMRLADLSIIAYAIIFYFTVTQEDIGFAYSIKVFRWLPMVFYPLMLMHCFGNHKVYDVKLFLIFTRKYVDLDHPEIKIPFRLEYFFIAITLLGAAVADKPIDIYYYVVCAIIIPLLWQLKPKRHSRVIWVALVLTAGVMGHFTHRFIAHTQGELQKNASRWFKNWYQGEPIQHDSATAIGKIGKIQLNHTILGRIRPRIQGEMLIKMSAYEYLLHEEVWVSRESYEEIDQSAKHIVGSGNQTDQIYSFETTIPGGTGYLPLPIKSFSIDELQVNHLYQLPNGGLRSVEGKEWVNYKARLGTGQVYEPPPDEEDLHINEGTLKWLIPFKEKNFPVIQDKNRYAKSLIRYFSDFKYSLELKPAPHGHSHLKYFLENTKSGHCEYYATCTVLLLRMHGIPARYVTGYRVDEYSPLEQATIFRGSDAHAWVRVWDEEKQVWYNLDTTPGGPSQRSWSSWIINIRDFISFRFWKWRFSTDDQDQLMRSLPFIIAAIVLYFWWRLRKIKRHRVKSISSDHDKDSDPWNKERESIRHILGWFAERGYEKIDSQTFSQWLQHLESSDLEIPDVDQLKQILHLYSQCLYDPRPLPENLQPELQEHIKNWLQKAKEFKALQTSI